VIGDDDRRDEESFWSDWQADHPQLHGAILDLAAAVLRRLPDIYLSRKPRMADYARILAAVDAEMGIDALARYASQAATSRQTAWRATRSASASLRSLASRSPGRPASCSG